MTIRAPMIAPLLLESSARMSDVSDVVRAAVSANARAQRVAAHARDDRGDVEPPFRWALVRHPVAFTISWFAVRFEQLLDVIEQAAGREANDTLFTMLGLKGHTPLDVVQLAELGEHPKHPAVVLAGSRVFGLLEPMLMAPPASSSRFGGASRDSNGRDGPTSSGSGRDSAAAPSRPPSAGGAPALPPRPSVRVDAAAYINAPRRVVPGKKFKLELGLTATPMAGVIGGQVAVDFKPDEDAVTLDIQVEAGGFEGEQQVTHRLVIPRDDPFTPRLQLWLAASPLEDGRSETLRALRVHYACNGVPCGSATWQILVQATDVAVTLPSSAPAVARVAIDSGAPSIDLTLRIAWQDDSEASHTLRWTYTTPHDVAAPVGKMVRGSSELAALPIGIVDELSQGDGLDGVELLVGGIGTRIAQEIPAGVWDVVRSVYTAVRSARGDDAVPTVLLLTQETRVPWELAVIPDPLPDASREPFFNTQCIITRWILDDAVRPMPPYRLAERDVAVVFGDYSQAPGVGQLPYAREEADFLEQQCDGIKFDATRQSIVQLLLNKCTTNTGATLAPRIVHFAGHGEAGRSSSAASFMVLNDGSTLSTSYFLNAPAFKKYQPLVFLNACQLGAGTAALGQPGGFAAVCVRGACSAVIAPLWSVNDEVAHTIATTFYEDVFGTHGATPLTVAEAMFRSREKPYTDVVVTDANAVKHTRTTATRMAYLVYGHPALRV